mgnify:CR=1 FL=1
MKIPTLGNPARRSVRLLLIVLSVGLLGGAFALARQNPAAPQSATPGVGPIVTGVTVVDVPVVVLNRQGDPIPGLTAASFRLFDDRRRQHLSGFDADPRPLSLAVVVDTTESAAVFQARRSAEVLTNLVLGAEGQAALFTAGSEPRQLLPFTGDRNRLVSTLLRLRPTGRGPDISELVQLAISRVRQQPRNRTRAVLVISDATSKGGTLARAVIEASSNDAIPVFRLAPNAPKGPAPRDPISPEQNGTGVGSQRVQAPPSPVDSRGNPVPVAGGIGNFNLGAVIGAVGQSLRSHKKDFVWATGGLSMRASNDADFDRKLGSMGDLLRSIYHLYYQPQDLTAVPQLHSIDVQLDKSPDTGTISFRRTYVGVRAQ